MHAAMLTQHPRHIRTPKTLPTGPDEPEEEDESPEEEDEALFGAGVGTKPGCIPAGTPACSKLGLAPTALAGGELMASGVPPESFDRDGAEACMELATGMGTVAAGEEGAATCAALQAQFIRQPGFFQFPSGVVPSAAQFLLLSVDEHSTLFQTLPDVCRGWSAIPA